MKLDQIYVKFVYFVGFKTFSDKMPHFNIVMQTYEATKWDLFAKWRLRFELKILRDLTVCLAWLNAKVPKTYFLQVRYFIINKKWKQKQ